MPKRNNWPAGPSLDVLTARMVGIGMNFAATPDRDADLEVTLVHASQVGMDDGDLRVLSVLTAWLWVHHSYVNPGRLALDANVKLSERVLAYWAAIASRVSDEQRWTKLRRLYAGPQVALLPVGTEFQRKRRGEDPRFIDSPLLVPAGTLRDRPGDVLAPEVLARRHAGYRNRVLLGPTSRAEAWTLLERSPNQAVAEVAARAGCSITTARLVARDFKVLHTVAPRTRRSRIAASAQRMMAAHQRALRKLAE
jgi:hypothetical protein